MSQEASDLEAARDIYEVANQLEGYVGPDTPERLAAFLMREGNEAAKLADEITSLRTALEAAERRAEEAERERDAAFAANERDRSIVSEVRTTFKAALARRSWLLDGRGSYEWDDDRWQGEFSEAIRELGSAIDPLDKIGIDWSLCPTNPDEVAAARIDWKVRAKAAESRATALQQERDKLKEALQPFAKLATEMAENTKPDDWTAWGYNDAVLTYGDFRRARNALEVGNGN